MQTLLKDTGLKRGEGDGKALSDSASAYFEYAPLHREHVGTKNEGPRPPGSHIGVKLQEYGNEHARLLDAGEVTESLMLNSRGYGRIPDFPKFYEMNDNAAFIDKNA